MTNMATEPKLISDIDSVLMSVNLDTIGNSMPNKPLVIIGHHGCGKDTVAQTIHALTGLEYKGSLSQAVMPFLHEIFIGAEVVHRRDAKWLYENRHNYSGYIKYTLDKVRTTYPNFVLSQAHDCKIITGVRTFAEIKTLQGCGANFIWVDRPSCGVDPTMDYDLSTLRGDNIKHSTTYNDGGKWDLLANLSLLPQIRQYDIKF